MQVEKEKEEEAKWLQKKAKASVKPEAVSASTKPTAPVTIAGTRPKRRRKIAREETEVQQKDTFLRNEPSPGAVTRDVISTISRGVTPRDIPANLTLSC